MASVDLRRRAVATGLWLAAQGCGALLPPLPQTGADCERPTYASDRLVCGDTALLALDLQLSQAWASIAAAQPVVDLPPLLEAQHAWFARRSRCAFVEAHAACLQAAYRDRATVLAAWQRAAAGAFAGLGTRMRCRGAPWGDAGVDAYGPTPQVTVLTGRDGSVLAIATPGTGQDGWQPFVQLDGAAPSIHLRPVTGAAISCSPA